MRFRGAVNIQFEISREVSLDFAECAFNDRARYADSADLIWIAWVYSAAYGNKGDENYYLNSKPIALS